MLPVLENKRIIFYDFLWDKGNLLTCPTFGKTRPELRQPIALVLLPFYYILAKEKNSKGIHLIKN